MFKQRSNKKELMDDLSIKGDDLRKNLDELKYTNHWFGSKKLLIGALNKIYKNYSVHFKNKKIVIADLGCGSGDLLRDINQWAKSKKLHVDLIGVDANSFMIQYATEKSNSYTNLSYQILNIFSSEFKEMKFDIITINSFCHHLDNATLISLYRQLTMQTHFAIIINDLHRHWISYYVFKGLAKIFNFSYLTKHDGSLSILRAFRKQELMDLLQSANINLYQIHWRWPFRWEIIIWLCG